MNNVLKMLTPHTYPPNTLVTLANGIRRYLRENNRPEINFMQKNSPVVPLFQKGIDAKMKESTQAWIDKFFNCTICERRNTDNFVFRRVTLPPLFYFCTKKRCIFSFSINDIDILEMCNYSYSFSFCFALFFFYYNYFFFTENGFLCLIIYCNPGRFSLFSNQT